MPRWIQRTHPQGQAAPNVHRLTGQLGGLTTHARHDSHAIAARARRGLDRKFAREAAALHPDWSSDRLAPVVARLRSLYFARLRELRRQKAARACAPTSAP